MVQGTPYPGRVAGRTAPEGVPDLVAPMHVSAGSGQPPAGPDWVVELAWTGHRCIAYVDPTREPGKRVRLLSANAVSMTATYPELAEPLERHSPPRGMVLDGTVVARAAPDGHALTLNNSGALVVNPLLQANPAVQPFEDLAPVALASEVLTVLVTPADRPWQRLEDLVAAARARPGELSWGHPGVGSSPWLAALLLDGPAGHGQEDFGQILEAVADGLAVLVDLDVDHAAHLARLRVDGGNRPQHAAGVLGLRISPKGSQSVD